MYEVYKFQVHWIYCHHFCLETMTIDMNASPIEFTCNTLYMRVRLLFIYLHIDNNEREFRAKQFVSHLFYYNDTAIQLKETRHRHTYTIDWQKEYTHCARITWRRQHQQQPSVITSNIFVAVKLTQIESNCKYCERVVIDNNFGWWNFVAEMSTQFCLFFMSESIVTCQTMYIIKNMYALEIRSEWCDDVGRFCIFFICQFVLNDMCT